MSNSQITFKVLYKDSLNESNLFILNDYISNLDKLLIKSLKLYISLNIDKSAIFSNIVISGGIFNRDDANLTTVKNSIISSYSGDNTLEVSQELDIILPFYINNGKKIFNGTRNFSQIRENSNGYISLIVG